MNVYKYIKVARLVDAVPPTSTLNKNSVKYGSDFCLVRPLDSLPPVTLWCPFRFLCGLVGNMQLNRELASGIANFKSTEGERAFTPSREKIRLSRNKRSYLEPMTRKEGLYPIHLLSHTFEYSSSRFLLNLIMGEKT